MKIVIRAPNWIGDAILALPAIETVRLNFPDAEIWIATRGWGKALYAGQKGIARILTLPDKLDRKTLSGTAAQLKKHQFDISLLLTNSFASALLFYWARIPERWGCGRDARRFLLTRTVDCRTTDTQPHQVHYYLNIATRLGLKPAQARLDLTLSPEEISWGAKTLAQYSVTPEQKVITLNPGGFYGSAKRWPVERFAALADQLQQHYGALIVIVGTAAEAVLGQEISSRLAKNVVDLTGKTALRELAAILAASDLCVTNDSGPMHMANALHIPVVAIFGPTLPAVTRPFQDPAALLHKPVDCWPCAYRDCPFDHRCMLQITAAEVFQTCKEMIL